MQEQMRPVRIAIERVPSYPLGTAEIKHTFRTLLTLAGLPWHFVHLDDPAGSDLFFSRTRPERANGSVWIKMSSLEALLPDRSPEVVREDGRAFLSFSNGASRRNQIITARDGRLADIHNDLILSSFCLLTGWQERFVTRDGWDRHNVKESFLFRSGLLHTPVVNQNAQILRSVLGRERNFLSQWPGNRSFAVALSHDTDYPEMIRWIESLRYLARHRMRSRMRKAADILRGSESFWRFHDWTLLEKRFGFRSAFYLCGLKGNLIRYFMRAPDPFYDAGQKRYREVMSSLEDDGFEVGLHGSYLAYQSEAGFKREKLRIEGALGRSIYGHRHHYWHMNPENPAETARIHHRIGLLYDSSIAFEKHSGFRYGVCSPFHLFERQENEEVEALQLPPTLMDDHLFSYAPHHGYPDYRHHIDALIDAVRKYEGVFVADYHVRVLNKTFFPEWGDSYEYLLRRLSESTDCLCETPVNLTRHWLTREKYIRECSRDDTA